MSRSLAGAVSPPPWCTVLDTKPGRSLLCERCGATKALWVPITGEELVPILNAFAATHAKCPPPTPPLVKGWKDVRYTDGR